MSSGKEFQEFRRRGFKSSGERVSRLQKKGVQGFRERRLKILGAVGSRVQEKQVQELRGMGSRV